MRSHSVLVWHLPTRQMSACIRLDRRQGTIKALAFGNTVKQLYVAQESAITGWSGENASGFVDMRAQVIRSLAVIHHGSVVASLRVGEADAALNIWGAETGHLRKTILLPVKNPGPLAAPPGGAYLALPTGKDCWIWKTEKLVS